MIESRDFSNLDYLTLERAVDQVGTRYAHVQVKPNVVIELGDSVLVGSDGILINMSQAQAALVRFLDEVKG